MGLITEGRGQRAKDDTSALCPLPSALWPMPSGLAMDTARSLYFRMRMSMWLAVLSVSAVGLLAESAAGVRWTAPSGWSSEGARPMRAATYRIAPAPGDPVGA